MISPVAAAWGVKGQIEPSTLRDRVDGYMFVDTPDTLAEAGDVYFNGWMTQSYIYHNSASPNVGMVAGQQVSSAIAPAISVPFALLGVWRDCNKDGYIGYGDPGLIEYPVSMPGIDTTLCAPKSVTKFTTQAGEQYEIHAAPRGLTHNDGKWIHEFIPIGWNQWRTMWDDADPQNAKYVDAAPIDDNPWDINDSDARVWMDEGAPNQSGAPSKCWMLGYPRGTWQSTGGIIGAHDCYTTYRVTDTLNSQSAIVDSTSAGQISFKDKPRDHRDSASKLNQKNPWGHEKDGSYVQPWDCSKPQQNIDDPTTTDKDWTTVSVLSFRIHNVSQPKVPPGGAQPNASPAGTVNETQSGFDECNRSPKNSTGNQPYTQLGEGDLVNSNKRIRPDGMLRYNPGSRQMGPHTTAWASVGGGVSPGTPPDFGVRPGYGVEEGIWRGDQQLALASRTYVNRDTVSVVPVTYYSFYAFVGPTATTEYQLKTPGSVGSYGSEGCALPTHLQIHECDATKWWPGNTMVRTARLGPDAGLETRCARDGTPADGCRSYGVRIGQAYQLRDIDCYDASAAPLRAEGISWGVASGTRCLT